MLPDLVPLPGSPWAVLPGGIHPADLSEVRSEFATNAWRRELFSGLVAACAKLQLAGCLTIYLDGSFVTSKPKPKDFDVCWDPAGVERSKLDPVFLQFTNNRAAQKSAFKGEFFPSSAISGNTGLPFIAFFQTDRFTGQQKGIVSISLAADPLLPRKAQP